MTSNVKRHVQLPRSSQKGKKPTAEDLKYGEIAVNFNNEDPFLAIKGSDDSIITMGFKDGKTGPWKKGEGEYSAVLDNGTPISPSDKVNTATGNFATAEGKGTTASGDFSHAEGNETKAKGVISHAEGDNTTAKGPGSHAEGGRTKAIGNQSHAEGVDTIASGDTSHAEGTYTRVKGTNSHGEGNYTRVKGTNSHGEGNYEQSLKLVKNIAVGDTKIFINLQEMSIFVDDDYLKNCYIVNNDKSYKIKGYEISYDFTNSALELTLDKPLEKASTNDNPTEKTFISEEYKFINIAVGDVDAGHSEGKYNMVLGESGHAEGSSNTASGDYSHAEGKNNMAKGTNSHAEGSSNTASGECSHAEGASTTASGGASHAEGNECTASGLNSHAEGQGTTANGTDSHTSGTYTTAENNSEFACGKYNKFNVNQIFSVGVGTTDNARKNALYITTDGVIGGDTQLTNGGTSMFGLKINGGIQASEGMISPTYLNSSDERLKKNIETISDDDIDKVKNVNLKSYVFKSDNSKHYGVIAQDVEKAGLSELVTNSSDGMKSVDYISLLILKISELENEIKNLKEQIKK